ncbi:nucleotidyltransferase substrate binding protein [Brachyspira aalborgi]|jgi:nucleotidyltransferase substrate binding protein (TIGR01987 family)|uniref:Nucleotidyltransferase n=1 Tax=Brachyspira aalborgi TaxID=29522 RepID=A0ABY3K700_9SPIR|nr:nucleotidyltransferase substrate binding protein [Brachyspira aalborgi]MBS4762572.1 nucleotidyltransferase substrate binding protein [Brachyspira sp.]TXJ31268.1 nucleotidyltransferase [Brachyspira aalborgi]TXJ40652.1 nucleotidyltransferase [Brachyspira aalborgi]
MEFKKEIRWKQRFQNFNRAYNLLNCALEENDIDDLSNLEQEGVIQRFEYTYELAWKTLKDYLEYNGVNITEITARSVFKEAYSSGIIKNSEIFIDMMLSRNLLSHTYDFNKFRDILIKVKKDYLPELSDLYLFFMDRILEK